MNYRSNKPISPLWYSLQKSWFFGIVLQDASNLLNGIVEAVLEIDVGFGTPNLFHQLLARNYLSGASGQNG